MFNNYDTWSFVWPDHVIRSCQFHLYSLLLVRVVRALCLVGCSLKKFSNRCDIKKEPDLYYVVEFCVLLLNIIHGEDLDVNKHLCHMIRPDVTFVPQSDSSQTVSHIGQSHCPLSHN